jgi:hypothetical protein
VIILEPTAEPEYVPGPAAIAPNATTWGKTNGICGVSVNVTAPIAIGPVFVIAQVADGAVATPSEGVVVASETVSIAIADVGAFIPTGKTLFDIGTAETAGIMPEYVMGEALTVPPELTPIIAEACDSVGWTANPTTITTQTNNTDNLFTSLLLVDTYFNTSLRWFCPV